MAHHISGDGPGASRWRVCRGVGDLGVAEAGGDQTGDRGSGAWVAGPQTMTRGQASRGRMSDGIRTLG